MNRICKMLYENKIGRHSPSYWFYIFITHGVQRPSAQIIPIQVVQINLKIYFYAISNYQEQSDIHQ